MKQEERDSHWMEMAIHEAIAAAEKGEVPVGAVLVRDNSLIARAGNAPISTNDPTGHAEILTLRKAGNLESNYRLPRTTLYVTLEPCLMCCAALIHARVQRVVFGAADPKTGALVSKYSIGSDGMLNHTFEICGGVLEKRCAKLLKEFFAAKRKTSQL